MSHVVASTLSLLSRGVIFKFSNDFDYSSIDFDNNTVKSHFKALGFYNFKRGFGWAYKRGGGLYPGAWAYKRNKKIFRNDEIKRI